MNPTERFLKMWQETLRQRHEWTHQASCRGLYEDFDVDEGDQSIDKQKLKMLRQICAQCPVIEECLNDAILFSDEYTFRAGLLPKERKVIRSKSREMSWDKKQEVLRGYTPKKRDFS